MYNLGEVLQGYIINTYLGNSEYEGNDDWGNFFYVELTPSTPIVLLNRIRSHGSYHFEYDNLGGNIMAIFTISEYQQKNIVRPFLEGRYSEIDREYVRHYFPQYKNRELSFNYRILTKDKYTPSKYVPIREYWKQRIGISLPLDAEVWSIPEKEDEIYLYLNLD